MELTFQQQGLTPESVCSLSGVARSMEEPMRKPVMIILGITYSVSRNWTGCAKIGIKARELASLKFTGQAVRLQILASTDITILSPSAV